MSYLKKYTNKDLIFQIEQIVKLNISSLAECLNDTVIQITEKIVFTYIIGNIFFKRYIILELSEKYSLESKLMKYIL